MTVRDLIDQLEDLAAEFGDETTVRLAQQPRWAFEYAVDEVQGVTLPAAYERTKQSVIYIGEGEQIGYLPHKAAVALGWSEARDDEDDDDDEQEGGAR